MKSISKADYSRAIPLLLATGAMFTIAGGYVHLREWLDVYRHVPAAAPGAFVVREGFLANALVSLVASVALVATIVKRHRATTAVIAAAFVFQATSLAALAASRTSNVFGWSERGWSLGASQSRAVELGALGVLGVALVLDTLGRNRVRRLVLGTTPAP